MTAPDVLGPSGRRRWQRLAQLLLVLTVVGATAGIVGLVVQNGVLIGRMTTDFSAAQARATNLANSQREALRLVYQVSRLEQGGDRDAVEIRRGLLLRQLEVTARVFPPGSPQAAELDAVQVSLRHFPWARLAGPAAARRVAEATALTLVSQLEVRVKALYDEQEKYFYEATIHSLKAKQDSQNLLIVLVSLVVVLGLCWLILLRRRTRSRLARAYHALVAEMTDRQALQEQLSHQAFHDALTGLPNRALFLRRLEEGLQDAWRSGGTVSTVLIDLDGFKNVNDTLGHAAGDELLQRAAERLRGCVLDGDTVARLGGDEFAIVIPNGTPAHGVAVSRRVLDALHQPIRVLGQEVTVSASIGVAQLGDHQSAEDLLSDADIAMYVAKRGGKARHEVFRQEMRDRAAGRSRLEQQLARAVELGEIEVHYQPVVDLGTDRVTAVEALARWRHPDGELMSPGGFIPVAEDCGLMDEIGREVLGQACRALRRWRDSVPGSADLTVAVNVSGRQLLSGDLVGDVTEALARSGIPAEALTLEITESTLLEDSDSVPAVLGQLKALGVRLAMDDFGTGYSSLGALLRFDVDQLKIDRSLLDFDINSQGSLIQAVTDLGRQLGLTIVAEGVESPDHLARVRAARCDAAQGYHLARPMAETAVRAFLAKTAREVGRQPADSAAVGANRAARMAG